MRHQIIKAVRRRESFWDYERKNFNSRHWLDTNANKYDCLYICVILSRLWCRYFLTDSNPLWGKYCSERVEGKAIVCVAYNVADNRHGVKSLKNVCQMLPPNFPAWSGINTRERNGSVAESVDQVSWKQQHTSHRVVLYQVYYKTVQHWSSKASF